ncbi:hypothetical protein ACHAXT_002070 [Thalassiosira profunda]
MLPIVPAGKKGAAARKRPRPRPRAPPSGAGGGRRKSSRPPPKSDGDDAPSPSTDKDAAAAEQNRNVAAPPAAKGGAAVTTPAAAPAGTAPANNELAAAKNTSPSPSPSPTPHTTNNPPAEEEDPLILAAEAAAALMDDLPAGSAGDVADISLPVALPAGLLDAVDARVDAAASVLVERGELDEGGGSATLGAAKDGGGEKRGGDGTLEKGAETEAAEGGNHPLKTASPKNAPSALPNNIGNPLGRNVRTFESKVPRNQDASAAQRRFLAYYYGQEAARGNALAVRTRKVNAEEEEEEAVEDGGEGGDAAGDHAGDTAEMEKAGTGDTGAKKKEGGKTAPDGRGGTLRDSIATLKRARYEPKRKDDKGHLWKAEDAEEADLVADPAAGGGNAAAEGSTADANQGNNGGATAEKPPQPTGPQVELDSAGRISVAAASLLPNPAARPTTLAIDAELGEVVEDATPSLLGAVNARYDSYAKPRQKPARWDADETRAWYRALRQCGTDFGMMAAFLPGRTRAQLKRKYKSEGRRHPKLVDMALDPRSRVRLDLSVFGDKLEIPDEVPAFQRVTPADSPAPGAAAATDAAGKEGGAKTGERNFDYLFEQDDGAAAGEQKEDAVVEECEPPAQKGAAVPAATAGRDDAAEAPTEGAKAPEAVVPLAPAVPKAKGAKRARFKAKPKGAKRARKK